MLEQLRRAAKKADQLIIAQNPSLLDKKDAQAQLAKMPDRAFSVGKYSLNPAEFEDRAKVFSVDPEVLSALENIIDDVDHTHYAPFILGTYNLGSRKLKINDFCLTDPLMAYQFGSGGEFMTTGALSLRALYYWGRTGIWRHETIHARHHNQMAHFLNQRKPQFGGWETEKVLDEAAETVYESGIEELLTRWQAWDEADGVREKTTAAFMLGSYLGYAPFTGQRNMLVDAKDKTIEKIPSDLAVIAAKYVTAAGLFTIPPIVDGITGATFNASNAVAGPDSVIPAEYIENGLEAVYGALTYALIGGTFSTKEKGALRSPHDNRDTIPTSEYKFPYTYNPVLAGHRSVDFLRFLSSVMPSIPHYRRIEQRKDLDLLVREVSGKLTESDVSAKNSTFALNTLQAALRPARMASRSQYPQDVYVKGNFIPAMYLNLAHKYR